MTLSPFIMLVIVNLPNKGSQITTTEYPSEKVCMVKAQLLKHDDKIIKKHGIVDCIQKYVCL